MRRTLGPLLATIGLAACAAEPPRYYTPAYAPPAYPPPGFTPYLAPVPVPLPPPAISATPLPPPGALDTPPVTEPIMPDAPPPPAVADTPPAVVDTPPGPSDPVTDLLLTPLPQRDVGQPTEAATPPATSPFMGFRPMKGQTPRSY